MKKVIKVMWGILLPMMLYSQYQWAKIYEGGGNEGHICVQQTMDGGYIVATGYSDVLVIKLNSLGEIEWAKTYGEPPNYEAANWIQQTSDGGYILTGWCYGTHGNPPTPEYSNILILKLNSTGEISWAKIYGQDDQETSDFIYQTSDGGYIVTGKTDGGPGYYDIIVMKLDSNGNVVWAKLYGGSYPEHDPCIIQTSDGGYIFTCETWSFGGWTSHFLVTKLDANGNVSWAKALGVSAYDDVPRCIKQTSDGGYIIAGRSKIYIQPYMEFDPVVMKINSNGEPAWAKRYEMQQYVQANDGANFICPLYDGYVVAGSTEMGVYDSRTFLLKITSDGNLTWGKIYNGIGSNGASCLYIPTNGYIIGGTVYDSIEQRTDIYILKTNSEGIVLSPQGDTCEGFEYSIPVISASFYTNTSVQVTVTSYSPTVSTATQLVTTSVTPAVYTECEPVGIEEVCNCKKGYLSEIEITPSIGKKFKIKYSLLKNTRVKIELYDKAGKIVKKIFEGEKGKGIHYFVFDAKNLVPGKYFCIVKTNFWMKKRSILVK